MRKTLGMLMAAGLMAIAPIAAFAEVSIEAALGEEEAVIMVIDDSDPYAIESESGAETVTPVEEGSADDAAPVEEEAPAAEADSHAG